MDLFTDGSNSVYIIGYTAVIQVLQLQMDFKQHMLVMEMHL